MRRFLIILLLCGAESLLQGAELLSVAGASGRLPLTTTRQLRMLSRAEASRALPLRLTGIVTYVSEDPGTMAFLQDETGGVYFSVSGWKDEEGRVVDDLKPGELVELYGFSGPGDYCPIITPDRFAPWNIHRLGMRFLPEARRLNAGELLDPSAEAVRVETVGVVRGLYRGRNRLVIELTNGRESFTALVAGMWHDRELPRELIDSKVNVRGVFSAIIDSERRMVGAQMYVQSIRDIRVLEVGASAAFDSPLMEVDELLQFRPDQASRAHVRGVVTAAFPGEYLFLRVNGVPLQAAVAADGLPAVGTEADVVGFPSLQEGRIILLNATVREGAAADMPQPVPVRTGQPGRSRWNGELVVTEGRLIDSLDNGDETWLLIDGGEATFPVRVTSEPRKAWAAGSWLRVTGIHLVNPDESIFPERRGHGYSLRARSAEDIVLLRRPLFWNARRIGYAAGALCLALMLVLLWSWVLSRKVRQQTAVIARTIASERVGAERTRIATELHDTVEQELVGIGLQLDLALARADGQDERLKQPVALASSMLRRIQEDVRRSVMDLHTSYVGENDFAGALRELVRREQEEKGITVQARIETLPHRLSLRTKHHLFRIVQEIIGNTKKHAPGAQVQLTLEGEEDRVVMEISDNGPGFDPAERRPGSLGIPGMFERARKIGAQLELQSRPGGGTRYRVSLPLPHESE